MNTNTINTNTINEAKEGTMNTNTINTNTINTNTINEAKEGTMNTNTINTNTINTNTINEAKEPSLICEYCGCIIEEGTEVMTEDGAVCEDCFQRYYVICDECDEIFHVDNTVPVYDGDGDVVATVCERCARWDYYYCEDCGRYFTEDAFYFAASICHDCAQRRGNIIYPYHHGNPMGLMFHGEREWSILDAAIGAELEVTGGDCHNVVGEISEVTCQSFGVSSAYEVWHAEDDCSVDGFEMIFQPRTIEDWRANRNAVGAILRALRDRDYIAEEGNGFHLHVGRSAFGKDADEVALNVAKIARLFSGKHYTIMQRLAGRTDDYEARRWASRVGQGESRREYKRTVTNRSRSRYEAINVTNLHTVEFRLGVSTLDTDRFMGWLSTVAWLCIQCHNVKMDDADVLEAWFTGAPEEVKRYLDINGVDLYTIEEAKITGERQTMVLKKAVRRLSQIMEAVSGEEKDTDAILQTLGLDEAERRTLVNMME